MSAVPSFAKRSNPIPAATAVLACCLCAFTAVPAGADEGVIEAAIEADFAIEKVYAIERRSTPTGVEMHRTEGAIENGRLRIGNLKPGVIYDLRFETEEGVIEGWDAENLPESNFVGNPPLEEEGEEEILDKIRNTARRSFFDEVEALDIEGNIQNAAVLLRQVRTRPFVGGGYRRGERIHRVDRQQWEDPERRTWQPHRELPWFAIERLRLMPEEFEKLSRVYARHLGGIKVPEDEPTVDRGRLVLPKPEGGVYAVDPQNRRIDPIRLKPAGGREDDNGDGEDEQAADEQATSTDGLGRHAGPSPSMGDLP